MNRTQLNIRSINFLTLKNLSNLFLRNIKYKTECYFKNVCGPKENKSISKLLYNTTLESQLARETYLKHISLKINSKPALKLGDKYHLIVQQNTEAVNVKSHSSGDYPKNWMEEYEFYSGIIDNSNHETLMLGEGEETKSTVPCGGCGAHLQGANPSLKGYIPMEIFKGRTTKELQTIICQRCHFLRHYNIVLDVEDPEESSAKVISEIKSKFALAIIVVDLLDFPCSMIPNIREILGHKRPIFIVGNKVDLLPRDSRGYLEQIRICLMKQLVNNGFEALNVKYVSLISAKTGFGIEELITQLHQTWKHKGDVFLLGCTNVGKSTLFNILLNSDYCRPEATDLVPKATVCPWPGTTLQTLKFPILRPSDLRVYQRFKRLLSERSLHAHKLPTLTSTLGRTFDVRKNSFDAFAMSNGSHPMNVIDENKKEYEKSRWCFDTPGFLNKEQVTNMLTAEELVYMMPEKAISPRAFRIKTGISMFLAGLSRIDFLELQGIEVEWIKIFVFTSLKQPVSIILTKDADTFYKENLGTEILGIPFGTKERLRQWPGLHCRSDPIEVVGKIEEVSFTDIMLSSVGWISVCAPPESRCVFRVWTPYQRGIFIREPALVPYATRLIGTKMRNSYAYNMGKPVCFAK